MANQSGGCLETEKNQRPEHREPHIRSAEDILCSTIIQHGLSNFTYYAGSLVQSCLENLILAIRKD